MSCTCHGCKEQYTVDVIVPNSIWEKIYVEDPRRARIGGGLLCPKCIGARIHAMGTDAVDENYKAFKLIKI